MFFYQNLKKSQCRYSFCVVRERRGCLDLFALNVSTDFLFRNFVSSKEKSSALCSQVARTRAGLNNLQRVLTSYAFNNLTIKKQTLRSAFYCKWRERRGCIAAAPRVKQHRLHSRRKLNCGSRSCFATHFRICFRRVVLRLSDTSYLYASARLARTPFVLAS